MAYRGPSYNYKVRKLGNSESTGDVFGITLPRIVAMQFSGCVLDINVSGNSIVMTKKEKVED